MSSQFEGKFERSSFGTQNAKAARRSVSSAKAQALVSRAKSSASTQIRGRREGN
ncbi:hypothetical protein GCM10009808_13600 [Microbacterium sediminicola]|uniref:DUF3606 domain-containing protein n=1 Tax=Microbacterium sediminicola TaxID=415210 RepID=A0ABN2I296_9MICO